MKTIKSFAILLTMGLGLVSCVENIESESVKAIRDAKATELLALADLHKAQAEAESLLAKAEAALLEAQARYENALAEGEELENQVAKANLELEIAAIKANLESELQYLMDQIASYKNSLNETLFSQLDYWFTELSSQTEKLFTYQTYLYNDDPYEDDAYEVTLEEKIYYKELLQELQSRNTYNEAIIAEYEKYIAANEIDVEALLPEVAALRGQIETLGEELYVLGESLDEIENSIYNSNPSDDVTSLYEHMENINDILFNAFEILDNDGDDYLDEDEGIFHLEPTADNYSYYIDINHEALARLDAYMDIDYSALFEAATGVVGTEGDKWNAEIPYQDNTLYAQRNYWAERVETFKTKFQQQINDVHTALMDAMDELNEANLMDAGEAKDAAVKDVLQV